MLTPPPSSKRDAPFPVASPLPAPEAAALRAELDAARQQLAATFAAQERFISNVSHELMTPIAVLLAQCQTLDRRTLPCEAVRFVESSCVELHRLGATIESFLMLSRVKSGCAARASAICAVNELVMECACLSATIAGQRGVELRPHLTDDLDATVVGDFALLQTMLNNLIRNAVRFSPAGEHVEIVVSVSAQPSPRPGKAGGPTAQITVRDFGPGIPSVLLDTIFNRFGQASEEHRVGRGHGLGLEIAQGVAELHGGTIAVRNLVPTGCEFTITLPVIR